MLDVADSLVFRYCLVYIQMFLQSATITVLGPDEDESVGMKVPHEIDHILVLDFLQYLDLGVKELF